MTLYRLLYLADHEQFGSNPLGRENALLGEIGPGTHLVRSKIPFLSCGTPWGNAIKRPDIHANKLLGYGPPAGTLAAERGNGCSIDVS